MPTQDETAKERRRSGNLPTDEEISLAALGAVLLTGRGLILFLMALLGGFGVLAARLPPAQYRANAVFVPHQVA